jgi:hypothetical protein
MLARQFVACWHWYRLSGPFGLPYWLPIDNNNQYSNWILWPNWIDHYKYMMMTEDDCKIPSIGVIFAAANANACADFAHAAARNLWGTFTAIIALLPLLALLADEQLSWCVIKPQHVAIDAVTDHVLVPSTSNGPAPILLSEQKSTPAWFRPVPEWRLTRAVFKSSRLDGVDEFLIHKYQVDVCDCVDVTFSST